MITRPFAALSAALLLAGLMLSPHKLVQGADSLQSRQQQALDMIENFAKSICNEIPLTGTGNKTELTGEAQLGLTGLLKKISEFKFGADAKYVDDKYQGFLRKDLIEALKHSDSCRLQIWRDLSKLVPSGDSKELTTSTTDTQFQVQKPSQNTQAAPSPQGSYGIAKAVPPDVGTKAFHVVIPTDVESMWVHYQDRALQSKDGCTRPPNADPISPNDVITRIGDFVEFASKNNKALIFTVYSPTRGWDSAAQEIRIDGKALTAMTPFWCNGTRHYGYEFNIQ